MNVLPALAKRSLPALAGETGMALREGGSSLAKYLAGAGGLAALGLGGAALANRNDDDEEDEKVALKRYLAARGM